MADKKTNVPKPTPTPAPAPTPRPQLVDPPKHVFGTGTPPTPRVPTKIQRPSLPPSKKK